MPFTPKENVANFTYKINAIGRRLSHIIKLFQVR